MRRLMFEPASRRDPLVEIEAPWACIVQREALGLTGHAPISEIYGIAPEVRRRVGCA